MKTEVAGALAMVAQVETPLVATICHPTAEAQPDNVQDIPKE